MSWTDERIEQLRTMWDKGMSASQIAEQLGGNITRNAVIGKAHRLGLKSRPSPVKAESASASPRPKPVASPPPVAKQPDPEVVFARTPPPVTQRALPPAPMIMPNTGPVPPTTTSHPMANRRSRPDGKKITLLDLTDKICKWPIGHPDEDDFHFCGAPVNPGTPYCLEHCAVAYQSQLPRKDKPRPLPMPKYRV